MLPLLFKLSIETRLGPCETSVLELLAEIANSFPADLYLLKLTIETLEQGVKYVQS